MNRLANEIKSAFIFHEAKKYAHGTVYRMQALSCGEKISVACIYFSTPFRCFALSEKENCGENENFARPNNNMYRGSLHCMLIILLLQNCTVRARDKSELRETATARDVPQLQQQGLR